MAFQADRFMSLLLNKSYAVDCKVDIAMSGDNVANRSVNVEDGMMKLARLVGKVLDITRKGTTTAYSEVLAIDLELNHFGSLIPLGPWETNAQSVKPPEKLGIKAVEMVLKNLVFLHSKLVLHLPWMLKSSTNLRFTHSRSSCLEAARRLLWLFQLIQKSEIPGLAVTHKCTPHSLLGYVAAVAVILGQMGSVLSLEDPQQIQMDEALVTYAIEAFHSMSTKMAKQSSSVLKQLIQLRDRQATGETIPTTLAIPLIGKIEVPVIFPEPSNPQEDISSTDVQMSMPTSWMPLVPVSTTIHEPQDPIYSPQYPPYVQSSNINLLYSNENLQYSNNDPQFLNNDPLYSNNIPLHSNNNVFYPENNLQYSSNDTQFPNYDLEHLNYNLQYQSWDFQWSQLDIEYDEQYGQ
jgi:hypothetical protein